MNIDWTLQIPVVFDIVHMALAAFALLLILLLCLKGRSAASQVASSSTKLTQDTSGSATEQSQSTADANAPTQHGRFKADCPDAALQLLALLQKEARLVDFIQEDLKGFSDEEVGTAARVVHDGAKKAIEKYFTLSSIRAEAEETAMTIEKGFDPQEIRLTGNVVGEAPYKGTLLHRGWKAEVVQLPRIVEGHNTEIIAPAEVEI